MRNFKMLYNHKIKMLNNHKIKIYKKIKKNKELKKLKKKKLKKVGLAARFFDINTYLIIILDLKQIDKYIIFVDIFVIINDNI